MPNLIIRFINTSDLVSDLIDFVTNSLWDHTELLDPENGHWIGAHAGSGVQSRPADYCTPTRERKYAIPVTADQLTKILAFARSKIGTPYNYVDIAGLFLHDRALTSTGREICSMFVTEATMAGELWLSNVEEGYTYLMTPEMVHLSPKLRGRAI